MSRLISERHLINRPETGGKLAFRKDPEAKLKPVPKKNRRIRIPVLRGKSADAILAS